ncbi:RIP metalloprotease RseP [Sphingosinicella rhizophila]|uniref:Zinc metalloprotease n=1 Tax=Sphingosinicella rhizophila TaxID=3050082 RepID=A0ABU3Q421_9SPHN|nr:RIP metalloprotease RseP [Sphingosinicella sp. GR2756]MDT9597685.1 RIP metalloprotease RseP [Sphingosinicella sp. GR2756]
MEENPGFFWTVLSFLVVIGPLVFVHELGHYFVGRWFGVKADAFSIGFGREITGWTDRRGTRWKIGWLPLGGYVKFAGDMGPASQPSKEWLSMPAEERARMFQGKPVWQRFLIVAAGPVTNFLFAIIIFSGFLLTYGQQQTPPVIAGVVSASAAAQAGLRAGDRILSISGKTVDRFEDIAMIVSLRPEQPLRIEAEREGRRIEVVAVPQTRVERDRFGNEFRKGLLGVTPAGSVIEPVPATAVVGLAVRQTVDIVTMSIEGIGQIITGRRSVKELGGPLKIAQYSGQQASLGLEALIWFMAIISINLGFINLLPIPLLDGGHLFFYMIEAVRRKPLAPEAQEWAFRTGIAALLTLMIFVTLNDLASFGLWSKLGGLIG